MNAKHVKKADYNSLQMGCDIHILVEFYDAKTASWVLMTYNDETGKFEKFDVSTIPVRGKDETDESFETRLEEFVPPSAGYVERDYHLFSYLADVRNAYGEAELDIIEPLSLPKGFPDDVTSTAKTDSCYDEGNMIDHHSYTWYTANDILKIDWQAVTLSTVGCMKLEKFEQLLDDRNVIVQSINEKDILYSGKCEVYKFPDWRCFHDKEKKRLRMKDNVLIEFHYHKHIFQNNRAVDNLMQIARQAYAQDEKARLLIWFDN